MTFELEYERLDVYQCALALAGTCAGMWAAGFSIEMKPETLAHYAYETA